MNSHFSGLLTVDFLSATKPKYGKAREKMGQVKIIKYPFSQHGERKGRKERKERKMGQSRRSQISCLVLCGAKEKDSPILNSLT